MNPRVTRALRAPFEARTWRHTAYVAVRLPLALVGFVLVLVTLAVGGVLSVTFVGLPLLAASGLVGRWVGSVHRRIGNALLADGPDGPGGSGGPDGPDGPGGPDGSGGPDGPGGPAGTGDPGEAAGPAGASGRSAPIPPPPPFRHGRGFLGWLQSALRDGPSWRARVYLLATFPLTLVTLYLVVMLWGLGAYWVTSPLWWSGGGIVKSVLHPLVGLGMVVAVPPVQAGLVRLDRALARSWLGPSASSRRVSELESARDHVVDGAAATLRRIERDLHDGTQAQLATLAMTLGQVKEKLEHRPGVPYDPDGAFELVTTAHHHAKEALVELRDLARGIHPPALDVGLDAALATLVERSAVPATLHADLPDGTGSGRPGRPAPAIETIAYFTVAELLANVARHRGATRARVEVTSSPGADTLTVRVSDDGHGGARPRPGSGLTGLRERVEAVDGRLDVSSPPGGPTTVAVELPLRT